jgi:hypothetical protein
MVDITVYQYHVKLEEGRSAARNSELQTSFSAARQMTITLERAAACGGRSGGRFPPDTKVQTMKLHPSLKPALWGAVAGAVAISVIGFSSMGWMLGSKAERLAAERAESAVVNVLTPICVEKFQRQDNLAARLIEFKKAASWDQRVLIEKGGWAAVPGIDKPDSAVLSACAERLGALS